VKIGTDTYLSTLSDIIELIKNSNGCINKEEAEELEFFEFLVFSHAFEQEALKKQQEKDRDKQELNELVVEGITALYKATRE
jgi:hypothetical protein